MKNNKTFAIKVGDAAKINLLLNYCWFYFSKCIAI